MPRRLDRRQFISQALRGGLAGVSALGAAAPAAAPTGRTFIPPLQESDERIFAAARRELEFSPEIVFCNTGTFGALPREVVEAVITSFRTIERDLPDWAYRPQPTDLSPITGYLPYADYRREVGAVLNAPMETVAFTQNATVAMSLLANGIDLERGDEILTTDQEHPGGISSWLLRERRHGIVVKQLPIRDVLARGPDAVVQQFADAITARTRVIMFSHITTTGGIKLPARELCRLARDRAILSVIDGAQAVGQMRVDVQEIGCDAYLTSTHKWMLAPKGTGVLYVRQEVQDRFWATIATTGFDDRTTGAFRFMHIGTGSLPQVQGLMAAVRFMNRLGLERVARWDMMITARLRDGLARMAHVELASPADPRLASAITTFAVRGRTSAEVQDALWKERIRVRAQGDAGVRLSAHFYVSPADIDRVLGVIESLA